MIGKIPKTGRGFRGTFNYLVAGKRDEQQTDKLAWMETRNLFVNDPDKIPSMMRATASQSKRCQKPVYHMIISWRPDEAPTDPIMMQVADCALMDMGLHEHQAVLAAHRDTDHRHLHIVVNRVHPETGKAWHTGKDWERLERSIARQALELGMVKVDGRHNTPEKMVREAKRARDGEYQMATRKQNAMPLDRWSVQEIKSRRAQLSPLFEQARSWDHLARQLEAEGLSLMAKGQGLVVSDRMGAMKLSDLGKDIRLKSLETLYRESFTDFDRRRALEPQFSPDILPSAQPGEGRPSTSRGRKQTDRQPTGEDTASTDRPCRDNDRESDDAGKRREDEEAREAEKEALRAQWRELRRAVSTQQQKPAPAAGANSDEDAIPQRQLPTASPHPAEPSVRQEAFASLSGAHAKLDLSRKLHDMGLIRKQDLMRAKEDVDAAREQVAKHQTFSEFVGDGVRDALSNFAKPANTIVPRAERKTNSDLKQRPAKDRNKDKNRDR